MQNRSSPDYPKVTVEVGKVIREPLEAKRKKDGNIAFKVTYVDSGWRGVCSNNLFQHNRAKRVWCGIQAENSDNCQSEEWRDPKRLGPDYFPCFDSVAIKTMQFSSGVDHGSSRYDTPRRCLGAKLGKLALFTSREPGLPESERFVFAIGQIQTIRPADDLGFEIFRCDKTRSVTFEGSVSPRFWNYYSNPNNPAKVVWGTGLFRYVTDSVARNLLQDIASDPIHSAAKKRIAKQLLTVVE